MNLNNLNNLNNVQMNANQLQDEIFNNINNRNRQNNNRHIEQGLPLEGVNELINDQVGQRLNILNQAAIIDRDRVRVNNLHNIVENQPMVDNDVVMR